MYGLSGICFGKVGLWPSHPAFSAFTTNPHAFLSLNVTQAVGLEQGISYDICPLVPQSGGEDARFSK